MEFESLDQIREYFAADEFATKCLGAQVDDYDPKTGAATVSMTVDDRHHNAQHFVMGGVFFSLADFALAVSANVGQGPSPSVTSSIQFMRRAKGDRLIATARPDKIGSTLAFYTVDIMDGTGRHCARMVASCMHTDR